MVHERRTAPAALLGWVLLAWVEPRMLGTTSLRCAVLCGLSPAASPASAAGLSAEQLVNTWPEAEIGKVIREFGEERHWRGIARRWEGASCPAVALLGVCAWGCGTCCVHEVCGSCLGCLLPCMLLIRPR